MARRSAIASALLCLCLPAVAEANGDPASDYLLVQSVFLPFNAKVPPDVTKGLSDVVRGANESGFKIRVAVIGSRYDLGTAFSLYNKPQRYAEFLGLELAFVYHGRLLVVMPNGFGYAVNGKREPAGERVVARLPGPGKSTSNEAAAATRAVRRLAAAAGHTLPAGGAGSSQTRDRLTLAAGIVALAALLAGIVFFRRGRA